MNGVYANTDERVYPTLDTPYYPGADGRAGSLRQLPSLAPICVPLRPSELAARAAPQVRASARR